MDPFTQKTASLPALLGGLGRAVLSVVAVDGKGEALREGHGFLFGEDGDLLTSRALLRGAGGARVRTGDGRDLSVRGVISEDREGGLVRLLLDGAGGAPPLRHAPELPEVGERVAVLCGASEPWPGVRMGTVSAVRHVPLSGAILEITAHVYPSGSGCPVVNLKGEMVGIARGHEIDGRGRFFAVPPDRLYGRPAAGAVPLPAWDGGEGNAEEPRRLGTALLWAEEFGRALPYLEEAARLDPGDGAAWYRLAFCHDALGRNGDAEAACRKALTAAPFLHDAGTLLGHVLSREGRHAEAAEARLRVVRGLPRDPEARYRLADSLERAGRLAESAAAYREAARLDPEFVMAWYRLGHVLSQLGRHEEEAAAYRRVIALRPGIAVARNNLGFALFRLGRHGEAAAEYREAIRIAPDFAVAHDNLGFALYTVGRHDEAVAAYDEAIRVMPDFAEAHNNRGAALAAAGRLPQAAAAYLAAVRIRPEFAEACYNLGSVQSALGRHVEALRSLSRAVRIRPSYPEAHYALGVVLVRLRRRGEAMEQYRILRTLDAALAARFRSVLFQRPH